MIKLSLITLFSLLFHPVVPAQAENLNNVDAAGKKHGKWLLLLDHNWKETTDTAAAVCSRYTYYDHGRDLYPMGPAGNRSIHCKTSFVGGNPVLLNGTYEWIDKKGILRFRYMLRNGEFVSYQEYSSRGTLRQEFDYSVHLQQRPHSWLIREFNKKGSLRNESWINGR